MDIGVYEVILGTSITAIAGFCAVCYCSYRNHNELEMQKLLTYAERVNADIRKMEEIKKLLNDDDYKKYLQQRVDVLKEMKLQNSLNPDMIKQKIDAVVGPYSFEEKEE